MNHGLTATSVEKIHRVLAQYPEVEQALLIGSRAKECHKPGSDIDLTLQGDLDRQTLNKIDDALDDELLPYQFSLSIYNQITDPDFLGHVDRVGKVFYVRPDLAPDPSAHTKAPASSIP